MGIVRTSSLIFAAGALAACAVNYDTRKTIEGNNTGGIIPPRLVAGNDPQTLANAHCAKYGTRARITFSGVEAGGDVVFVCETAAGPAVVAGAAAAARDDEKAAPAKR